MATLVSLFLKSWSSSKRCFSSAVKTVNTSSEGSLKIMMRLPVSHIKNSKLSEISISRISRKCYFIQKVTFAGELFLPPHPLGQTSHPNGWSFHLSLFHEQRSRSIWWKENVQTFKVLTVCFLLILGESLSTLSLAYCTKQGFFFLNLKKLNKLKNKKRIFSTKFIWSYFFRFLIEF